MSSAKWRSFCSPLNMLIVNKKLTEDDPRNLYTSVLQLMPGEQYDAVSVKCEI